MTGDAKNFSLTEIIETRLRNVRWCFAHLKKIGDGLLNVAPVGSLKN